jgi:hypothetical protein
LTAAAAAVTEPTTVADVAIAATGTAVTFPARAGKKARVSRYPSRRGQP